MPGIDELLEKLAPEALKSLKKILASKGKLQGNFYFAGDARGKQAAVVVTLLARDPRGARALSDGKKLRAGLEGAKFAVGIVRVEGAKLIFEIVSGSATSDVMKIGFKKGLSGAFEVLSGLLRKARFASAGGEDAPADAADAAPDAADDALPELGAGLDDLDAAARAEIEELIQSQGDLAQRSADLRGALRRAEESEQQRQERIGAGLAALSRLEERSPPDVGAIQRSRYDLAESLAAGPDPFPADGERLAPEAQALFDAAQETAIQQLIKRIEAASAEIQEALRGLEGAPPETRELRRMKLLAEATPQRDALSAYLRQLGELRPR